MAKKPKVAGVPFGAFAAVTVYADLLSLLLTLFVVLFAISEPKRPMLAATMAAAQSIMKDGKPPAPPKSPLRPQRTTPDELGVLRRGPPGKRTEVQSITEDGRQKLVLGGAEFFQPGSAVLSAKARQAIKTYVAPDMRGFDNRVEVTGHATASEAAETDPWTLASERATAVMRYLVDECGIEEKRFRLISAGDAEPRDPESDAMNRRVEIIMTELRTG